MSARRVALVGGHGGMTARYRGAAEAAGWELEHFERKAPRDASRLVILCGGLCSHSQRDEVRALGCEVVVIGQHSPSAVRRALEAREAAC